VLTATPSALSLKKSNQVIHVNPLYVDRGLKMSLKVDEMCRAAGRSYVGKKKQPRWLWRVEDAVTGEIIAFVFGRRTHQTFRHLLSLLEQAKIEVIRWITDSWCGAARTGLF